MNRKEFEGAAHLEAQQRQAELEAQKGNPHFQRGLEENFSITYANAVATLGEPSSEEKFPKRDIEQIIAKWPCGCEFHETESGSGVLFACEEHSTDA